MLGARKNKLVMENVGAALLASIEPERPLPAFDAAEAVQRTLFLVTSYSDP